MAKIKRVDISYAEISRSTVDGVDISIRLESHNIVQDRTQPSKMVVVKDQPKCRLTMLLFVYEVCLSVNVVVSDTECGIVERINRRLTYDIYYFINSSSITCDSDGNTYLISENQCVKDQELYAGKLIHIYNATKSF